MKKILFVDDEPNILTGLKRMLRSQRHEWDMVVADSGRKALQILAENGDFEVIISDLRMPEMDGVELLTKVKELYPQIIRIVLSGHSDYNVSLESTRVAHQYLSKPCEAEALKQAVQRNIALKEILTSEALRSIVGQEAILPTPSRLYHQLTEEIGSPDSNLGKVADLLSQDVAMTAKILQLINSAFFGLPRNITRLSEAVNYLGLNTIRGLVLMTETFGSIDDERNRASVDRLWKHSLQVANLAKAIARHEGMDRKVQELAFLAGMLHDVGYLVLISAMPELMDTLRHMRSGDEPNWRIEQKHMNCSHAEIGGYLLGIWGLPNALVEAVVNHHQPGRQPGSELNLNIVVHVADALVHPKDPTNANCVGNLLDRQTLKNLALEQKLDEWEKLVGELEDE